MMLGKRPRPPMRRTTSMTEFSPDIVLDAMITDGGNSDAPQPSDEDQPGNDWLARGHVAAAAAAAATGFLSPRPHNYGRRSSGDFRAVLETAAFLKSCGLCKRRLGPGRDIYIYRGEVAFCSLECRQQLMNQEERNDKCALSSIMAESPSPNGGSEPSANNDGETVAAA